MTLYIRFVDNPDIVKWYPDVIAINKYPNGHLEVTRKADRSKAPLLSFIVVLDNILSVESN